MKHRKRSIRNSGCVYTGRVGAPMKPRRMVTFSRRVHRSTWRCNGGPFSGRSIRLDVNGGGHTLPIIVRGEAGCYRGGNWVPA